MARAVATVRRLGASDRDEFVRLWTDSRIEAGMSPDAAARHAADGSIDSALARPEVVVVLASIDGHDVGFCVLADGSRSVFAEGPSVSVDMIYVGPDHRKHGVGKALLAAAARHADRTGSLQLVSSVPAQNRELNRYFARLGFAPETTRRVVASGALLRRLSGERESPRYTLDAVLARRREARVRALRESSAAQPAQVAAPLH